MSIAQAMALGVLQGLTEFFPISSSGHLVVLPLLSGWEAQPLVFDTTLHLGTALALILFFWRDLCGIVKGFLGKGKNAVENVRAKNMGLCLVVGSIPAGLVGLLFGGWFESSFRSVSWVATFLILGSILMALADARFRADASEGADSEQGLSLKKSFKIGVFQVLALFPGFSRSGATISGGMLLGLNREAAARFSFLLSIPVVLGAGILKGMTSLGDISTDLYWPLLVGFLSSFITGLACIKFLLKFLKKNDLDAFVVYRMLLAVVLILIT